VKGFKEYEELVIADDKRKSIGIATPRDALEITLPRQDHTPINIANVSDYEVRRTIEEHIARFLKKIHRKRENVQSVLVYADKYKTRKYSLRARLISTRHVISAKAVGYDPLSATKKLISILDGRIRTERGKKARQISQQRSGRHLLL
jgi:ribosome-associated translation inhibitor RaiA